MIKVATYEGRPCPSCGCVTRRVNDRHCVYARHPGHQTRACDGPWCAWMGTAQNDALHKKARWRARSNECERARHDADIRTLLLKGARARSKARGVPCTIVLADIFVPDVCPVFGTPFHRGRGIGGALPSSPSLDRVRPEAGYVPGNVRVISRRANSIKSDATLEELRAVAKWLASVEAGVPYD